MAQYFLAERYKNHLIVPTSLIFLYITFWYNCFFIMNMYMCIANNFPQEKTRHIGLNKLFTLIYVTCSFKRRISLTNIYKHEFSNRPATLLPNMKKNKCIECRDTFLPFLCLRISVICAMVIILLIYTE